MADVNETIEKRESVHGDFRQNAACSQQLKEVFRVQPNWPSLSLSQRESLEQIALKISRILTGNHNEPDHWHDVGGYAGLEERILLGTYPPSGLREKMERDNPVFTVDIADLFPGKTVQSAPMTLAAEEFLRPSPRAED